MVSVQEQVGPNSEIVHRQREKKTDTSRKMARLKKEPKPKRGFLDGYKTYDPSTEGYGSPLEWRDAFFERLGLDKANEVLGADDPLILLGITSPKPTWEEITNKFRRLILSCHPDRNPDSAEAAEKAKKVIAAFEVLEARYGPKN